MSSPLLSGAFRRRGRSEGRGGKRGNLPQAPNVRGGHHDGKKKRVPLRLGGGATESFAPDIKNCLGGPDCDLMKKYRKTVKKYRLTVEPLVGFTSHFKKHLLPSLVLLLKNMTQGGHSYRKIQNVATLTWMVYIQHVQGCNNDFIFVL